jgi:DNA modification methylase
MLSEPGDIVLDPFSGRGTTLLESRLLGRMPIATDLNPIAVALSQAKNITLSQEEVHDRLEELRGNYDSLLYIPEAQVQDDDIQLIFHHATLGQLCYLRRKLLFSGTASDKFLLGSLLGIMHGSERQGGTSAYASISMPNTFSMSPNYVRKFVEKNSLNRVFRDVFQLLKDKVDRLFREPPPCGSEGLVITGDAKKISSIEEIKSYRGQVKLALTSPPYLDVVNYAKQNWIRSWLLAPDPNSRHALDLDDNLTLRDWLGFIGSTVASVKELLRPDGVLVMVVGDVAKASRSHISLARELIQRLQYEKIFSFIGCLDDYIGHDIKTTRIWKDTKGRATVVDRIIILSNVRPTLNLESLPSALGLPNLQIENITSEQLESNAEALAGATATAESISP